MLPKFHLFLIYDGYQDMIHQVVNNKKLNINSIIQKIIEEKENFNNQSLKKIILLQGL